MTESKQTNVLGEPLQPCCSSPVTGYLRDGFCSRAPGDGGMHIVCTVVTDAFLTFSASRGNDLSTPVPPYHFPGLKPGDRWCLCVQRWVEALEAGCAPPVDLAATHASALEWVSLDTLKEHAVS
jgi:uncharacterized protein (DUF2237 family)